MSRILCKSGLDYYASCFTDGTGNSALLVELRRASKKKMSLPVCEIKFFHIEGDVFSAAGGFSRSSMLKNCHDLQTHSLIARDGNLDMQITNCVYTYLCTIHVYMYIHIHLYIYMYIY